MVERTVVERTVVERTSGGKHLSHSMTIGHNSEVLLCVLALYLTSLSPL